MFNLKTISIIFFMGFLLSFLAGIVGQVSFGVILLRAILSGGVFVLLYFGAITVYNHFLAGVESSDSESSEQKTEESANSVDIVVEDELPDSATAPSFNVADYTPPPNANSQQESSIENQVDVDTPAAFQNSSLASMTQSSIEDAEAVEELEEVEPETMISGSSGPNENTGSSVAQHSTPSSYNVSAEVLGEEGDSELGELPDIESLGVDESEADVGNSDDVIQDSVFAETGATRPSAEPVAVSEMGDAKDIAAAIRTAMAKDT